MTREDIGHQPRCPHCGNALRVSIAYQVEKVGSFSPDYLSILPDGTTEEGKLFSKRALHRMADDADAARDQHEVQQRWRGY